MKTYNDSDNTSICLESRSGIGNLGYLQNKRYFPEEKNIYSLRVK